MKELEEKTEEMKQEENVVKDIEETGEIEKTGKEKGKYPRHA